MIKDYDYNDVLSHDLTFYFGITGKEVVNKDAYLDFEHYGQPIFDELIDLSKDDVQMNLANFCEQLRS